MAKTTDKVITLKSKLSPPRLKDILPRERLYALFDDVENYKVVTVIAGAGYGKTTYVAQACQAKGVSTVWYRLDASDGDAIVFLNYLVAGIRQYYSNFGHETLALIRRGGGQLPVEPQQICTLLLHELENCIDRHLLIVLDDFHLIQQCPEILTVMGALIQNLPHRLHFVLVSRSRPDLALARLIAVRKGFGIKENDLAFSRVEIERLYRDIFDIPLEDKALSILEEKSGGWVAGLILFHYRLKKQKGMPMGRQLSYLTSSADLFSSYLEENIFQCLPGDMASFLIRTSILSVLDVDLCNQLLEIEEAESILDRLEKMHLFTFAIDDTANTYQYHHLFRDYLRDKLKKNCEPQTVARLHQRAGRLLEDRGDIRNAIEHYFAARDYESAAALMVMNGSELIENGQVNQFVRFSEKFPRHLVEKEPWLQYFLGYAFLTKGESRASQAVFEIARQMFEKKGDQEGVYSCMVHLATLYYIQDDFHKAETAFRHLIERIPPDLEAYWDAKAYSLANLIFIASRLFKNDQAEHYYKLAKHALSKSKDPLADALVYIHYGFHCLATERYHEALQLGEKAETLAKQRKAYSIVVLSCHLIASAWGELEEYEKSLAAAQKGIRIGEAYGFLYAGYIWCLIDATFSAISLGHLAEALVFSQKGLQANQHAQSDWTGGITHLAHGIAELCHGNLDSAEVEARKALIVLERTPIQADIAKAQMFLSWILLKKGRHDEAMGYMLAAETFPEPPLRFKRLNLLFHACYDMIAGRMDSAKTWMRRLIRISPNPEKMILSAHQAQWMIPLLVALHREGHHRDRIESLLSRLSPQLLQEFKMQQPESNGSVRNTTSGPFGGSHSDTPGPLRIQCLGQFRLWRGDVELTAHRWTSAKAKTLFKFLVLHAQRGYQPKERLLELLWPDEDPEVTTKRLHVALTTVRKVLEPGLPRGTASAYLLRDIDGYKLNLGDGDYFDLIAFDDAIAVAQRAEEPVVAIEKMLKAEALYKGDLFEEDPYRDWCAVERDKYREKYVWLLKQIIDHYETVQMYDKSIDLLNRLLQLDDFDEQIYRRLMVLYGKIGNRKKAMTIYAQCKHKIEQELDCPLSDDTQQVYNAIISA